MISCKGCPFLYDTDDDGFVGYKCTLFYDIKILDKNNQINPTSENCKLEAVSYMLKNKVRLISFIPKEIG